MRDLKAIAACLFGALLAACSGAPSENTPDYEITTARRDPPPSTAGSATKDSPTAEVDAKSDAGSSAPSTSPSSKSSTASVTIDGTKLTVGGTNIWAEVSKAGDYDIFIKVTGPGVEEGSDIHVKATRVGAGCAGDNYLDYRPENDTQYMVKRGDAACGLSIDELPTAVGGRFKGSFQGALPSINVTPVKSKDVVFTFDVLRTK